MKRFTATEKWADPWFRRLSPKHKALWLFLLDNCNHAGIWQIDWELATFQIGDEVGMGDIRTAFEDRCEEVGKGRLFVPKFVRFQYGEELNDANPAHRGVIRALEEAQRGLSDRFKAPSKGLQSPIGIGIGKGEGPEGGQGETAPPPVPAQEDGDPDRELSADEIVNGVKRIFKTPRPVSAESLHRVSESMPVKASELAELERFYAAPPDPDNPAMARCQTPKNLCCQLGDQLVKARDFCARLGHRKRGANGHGVPGLYKPPDDEELRRWKTSLPADSEWLSYGWKDLPEAKQSEFFRWRRRQISQLVAV